MGGNSGERCLTPSAPFVLTYFFLSFFIAGKVLVTKRLLERIRDETNDRVVIVSTSTRTLDMLQDLIIRLGLEFVRLDGSVAASKRQAASFVSLSTLWDFADDVLTSTALISLCSHSGLCVSFSSQRKPSIDLSRLFECSCSRPKRGALVR